MFRFKASCSLVGIEVRSLKHHGILPSNSCSVQREPRICRKRTLNVDLPDLVGPSIIQVNVCLNMTSVLIVLHEIDWFLSSRESVIYTLRDGRIVISMTPLEK